MENTIQNGYEWCYLYGGDIREHILVLRKYAEQVKHITEFGVRDVISTWAFLAGRPQKLVSYDIYDTPHAPRCMEAAKNEGLDWSFIIGDTLKVSIEPTDLLFIDTLHTYDQLRQELALHAKNVRNYIILHDTTSYEHTSEFVEGSIKGLWDAVTEFLQTHEEWFVKERYTNCSGLTILERGKKSKLLPRKLSIVIPTWNHLEDLLIPTVESVERNTSDNYDIEFVFSANGCVDGTEEWLKKKHSENPDKYKYYITKEQIGFTKACNEGFKRATNDYIMVFNNDILILDWGKDIWLDRLFAPFDTISNVGATGTLKLHDPYSDRDFLVGFCILFRPGLLKEFGYFDEIYAPAAGEDVDIGIKLQDAGWQVICVADTKYVGWTNASDYPMWHRNNMSYGSIEDYSSGTMRKNGLVNAKKYNKHLKLNLGSGGVEFEGYLSVDNHDKRARIEMDIAKKMDFDDSSVEELLASHVFEHLNPYFVIDILKEWNRILKPGGKLILELPNIEALCKDFTNTNDYQDRFGILNCIYGSVNTTSEGESSNITSSHLFGWWPESVFQYLSAAGFVDVIFLPEQIHHPVMPHQNMRVECIKPMPKEPSNEAPKMNVSELATDSGRMTTEEISRKEIWELNTYGVDRNEIEGKVVIDVGAFNGDSSLYFMEMGAKEVHAFEMNPDNYAKLVNAIKEKRGITAYNIAVHTGEAPFVKFTGDGGTCKVSDTGGSLDIPARSLQWILREVQGFQNDDLVLKIDCEGAEFPILMNTSPEWIRRFSFIYAEIHGEQTSGHAIDELVKYLTDIGFEPHHQAPYDVFYYEKDHLGEIFFTKTIAQTYKFIRKDVPVNVLVEKLANPYGVTAYISTKDRYFTTLPVAIASIANQTFKVDELIIFDDGEQRDLREESLYVNIFKYLQMKNISWKVLFGERRGQVANHQKALDLAKTEYIWRVDDDNMAEPTVLETLISHIITSPDIGGVGSLVRVPNQEIFPLENCSGDIQKSINTPNLQWSAFSGIMETDHLHNTFLYRKSAAAHGYPKNLSVVGHREETLFSYGIRQNGFKLLVCGDAITWHFRESKGGIRSFNDTQLWEHDEQIFRDEMKKRGVLFDNKKYVVLDNGIGDHYAFKHILPRLIEKYGTENLVLATCFPDVFWDMNVHQISIADANNLFGDLTRFNIYHWMWRSQVKESIVKSFERMYL